MNEIIKEINSSITTVNREKKGSTNKNNNNNTNNNKTNNNSSNNNNTNNNISISSFDSISKLDLVNVFYRTL